MSRRLSSALGFFVLLAVCVAAQTGSDRRTIQVEINYTGSGTVNASHKIYVALWDSSDGVDFVVIGGIAGIAHGSSYPSYDLDLAYARDHENIERLVAALSAAFGLLAWDVQQNSAKSRTD